MANLQTVLKIHKQAGQRKKAIRINGADDIPEFLQGSIVIAFGRVFLDCVEGHEECPLGSVIGYERSEKTVSGWNCWCIGNADTNLIERDGVFYTKATILEATPITEEFPELMRGANIWRNDDGSWSFETKYGIMEGKPFEAYWVKSGENQDGTPKGYILTRSEESLNSFLVCDEAEENDLGWLWQYSIFRDGSVHQIFGEGRADGEVVVPSPYFPRPIEG